jgi:uncharacterized protein (UPF0335 family)
MARTLRANTTVDEHGNEIEQEPTRRGRPSKHPLPMGSNVTDETIDEFCDKALAAKTDLEKIEEDARSQRGVYRAILKDAKKAGVDPDAITDWLKLRKKDPEDINRDFAWKNRIYRLRKLPVGTQLGVDFETGETIATQVDERQTRKGKGKGKGKNGKGEADPRAAYIMGYDAGKAGKSAKTTGKGITGDAAIEFQKGWSQGMKDAAKELGPESTIN